MIAEEKKEEERSGPEVELSKQLIHAKYDLSIPHRKNMARLRQCARSSHNVLPQSRQGIIVL